MGCKRCVEIGKLALEKLRLIDPRKRQTLAEACIAGDQASCQELERMKASEAYRADKFRSEHHRRAATEP